MPSPEPLKHGYRIKLALADDGTLMEYPVSALSSPVDMKEVIRRLRISNLAPYVPHWEKMRASAINCHEHLIAMGGFPTRDIIDCKPDPGDDDDPGIFGHLTDVWNDEWEKWDIETRMFILFNRHFDNLERRVYSGCDLRSADRYQLLARYIGYMHHILESARRGKSISTSVARRWLRGQDLEGTTKAEQRRAVRWSLDLLPELTAMLKEMHDALPHPQPMEIYGVVAKEELLERYEISPFFFVCVQIFD